MTQATRPRPASKAATRGESRARRTRTAALATAAARTSGLIVIQARSPTGRVASMAGCAQYELTKSVIAQMNAARPLGMSA